MWGIVGIVGSRDLSPLNSRLLQIYCHLKPCATDCPWFSYPHFLSMYAYMYINWKHFAMWVHSRYTVACYSYQHVVYAYWFHVGTWNVTNLFYQIYCETLMLAQGKPSQGEWCSLADRLNWLLDRANLYWQRCDWCGMPLLFFTSFTFPSLTESRVLIYRWMSGEFLKNPAH